MIANRLVHEIEHALADGTQSQRAIARRFGVARATVIAIARGARRPDETSPLFERCPTCSAMVELPCRRCAVLALPPVEPAPEFVEQTKYYVPTPAQLEAFYREQFWIRASARYHASQYNPDGPDDDELELEALANDRFRPRHPEENRKCCST